ncbi:MAG: hypothetical protein ACRDRA_02120, partial [Pseudonocardiaceae bacterium]
MAITVHWPLPSMRRPYHRAAFLLAIRQLMRTLWLCRQRHRDLVPCGGTCRPSAPCGKADGRQSFALRR